MDDLKISLAALAGMLASPVSSESAMPIAVPEVERPVPRKRRTHAREGNKHMCLTLNGFLIDLLRKSARPMLVEELNKHVKANIKNLRRSDGSNYKGDLYKILIGVLSNCSAFCSNSDGWTIDEQNARNYEESTLKNINRRLGKYRIKSYDERKTVKIFQHRIRTSNSMQLQDLIETCDCLLLDQSFKQSLQDLTPDMLSVRNATEALRHFGPERLAGIFFMHKLLQEGKVLQGAQGTADLAEVKRKVGKLAAELYEVEKWLNQEDDLLTGSFD